MNLETIGIIINLTFIVGLVLALLNGFLKGFWKKTRSLIGLVVGIILLLIFMNPIANGIARMQIPGLNESVNEVIMTALADSLNNGKIISEGSELYILCSSLTLSIIKMVILLLGILVVVSVIVPLITLILNLILGKDEHPKTLGIRFGGAGVSLVQFLICTFLLMLPVYGFSSLFLTYEKELSNVPDTEEVVVVIKEIDETIPNKMNKIFGDDTAVKLLGSLTKVKNEHGTINIIKEIQNIEPLLSIILETQGEEKVDFLEVLVKNRQEIVEFIKKSSVLETFMPALIEILESNGQLKNFNVEELKKINFQTDKVQLATTIDVICKFIEETNFTLENPQAVLKDPTLPTALKSVGEALKETSFINLVLELLQGVIDKSLGTSAGEFSSIVEALDLTKIEKTQLPNDLYNIGKIVNSLAEMGLLEGNANLFEKPSVLKDLINSLFDLSTIKGSEKELVDGLLAAAGIKGTLSSIGIELNYENVDWSIEKVNLGNIIEQIGLAYQNIENFDFSSIQKYFLDSTYHPHLRPLLVALSDTALIDFSFITDVIESMLMSYGVNTPINKDNLPTAGNWEKEIDNLLKAVGLVGNIDELMNNYEENVDELGELLDVICSSQILNPIGKEMLEKVISSANIDVDMNKLDVSKVVSWKYEVEVLLSLKNELAEAEQEIIELPTEQLEEIFKQAAGTEEQPCYVSSYIVGSLINLELKEILSDETYHQLVDDHDLTQPQVLRESIQDIISAIKLSKTFENVVVEEDITKEQVEEIVDIYGSLNSSTTVTNAIIKDIIIESDIDLTEEELEQIEYEKEAAFLEEVLTAISENASEEEIAELIAKAEEETIVAIAIINKYFK